MSTPERNFETAIDDSSDREAREDAIDGLEAANECDMLADLVRMDDLETAFRERAVDHLATPQCKPTLEMVASEEDVPKQLRDRAERLMEDVPDDIDT